VAKSPLGVCIDVVILFITYGLVAVNSIPSVSVEKKSESPLILFTIPITGKRLPCEATKLSCLIMSERIK